MDGFRTSPWRWSLGDFWRRVFGRPFFGLAPLLLSRIASFFRLKSVAPESKPILRRGEVDPLWRSTLSVDPATGEPVFGPHDLEREEVQLEWIRHKQAEVPHEKTSFVVYGRELTVSRIRDTDTNLVPFEWRLIDMGVTGQVYLLKGRALNDHGKASVLKLHETREHDARRELETECEVYRRLGSHPRIVPMRWGNRWGICLEYMPNGNPRVYLKAHPETGAEVRRRWASDAAEALQLLHDVGVIHSDTSGKNFLVDNDLRLRIVDFAGSSMDGSKPTVGVSVRSRAVGAAKGTKAPVSAKKDLFALGSLIFEIMTGAQPYKDRPSDEIEPLYRERQFPDVTDVVCGEVIRGCWLGLFDTVSQVQEAIDSIGR